MEWITKNTTTEKGAEAKFLIAEIFFLEQEYDKADVEIKSLIKMKPTYNYWVAKGLLLQAEIQVIKEDLFQAEQILQSIIDHYTDQTDGIIEEANSMWNELMQLKNTDKEVPEKSASEIEVIEENK